MRNRGHDQRRAGPRAVFLTGAALVAVGLLVFAGSGSAARATTPTNTTKPSIYGTQKQGETIHADHGKWTPSSGTTYEYQWFRCKSDGSDCNAVTTALSSNDYQLGSDDVGKRLYVSVRATNSGDQSAWVSSGKTGVIVTSGIAPSNRTQPEISGTAQDNQTLTASPGTWIGADPKSYSYTWQRCDSDGKNCSNIYTGQSYRVTSNDVGHRLRVLVRATNSIGSGNAASDPTAVVLAAGSAPRNTVKASIAGVARLGSRLTANVGTWAGSAPITYLFQWYRCDGNGNNCGAIGSAFQSTYTLTGADVGHRIRVVVVAKNGLGSAQVFTDPTAVVVGGAAPAPAPRPGGGGVIAVSRVALPNRLVISRVQFTPRVIRSRTQPLVARFLVVDSRGRPVVGALVYAVGVPANRVVRPPETRTDGGGWATVSFRPARGLPFRRGARLTIFVRARKPGDSVLAGVSTRRLVSIAVRPG